MFQTGTHQIQIKINNKMMKIEQEAKMNIWEAIKIRHSSKAYKKTEFSKEDIEKLKSNISNISKSFTEGNEKTLMNIFPEDANIKVVYIKGFHFGFPLNSMYSGSDDFLALVGPKELSPIVLTKAAVIFEKVVLQLTQKGLETGWMGSKNFTAMLYKYAKKHKETSIDFDNEIVYAMSPFGKGKDPNLMVRMIRKRKNSKKLFFDTKFGKPLELKEDDPLSDCFESVKLAPSHFNQQSWKLIKDGKKIHFFTNPTTSFYSHLNIGTSLYNWAAICDFKKIKGSFEVKKDLDTETLKIPKSATYICTYSMI